MALRHIKTIEKKLKEINYNSIDDYLLHCVRNRVKKRELNPTIRISLEVIVSKNKEFLSEKTLRLWDLLGQNYKKNRVKISKNKIKNEVKRNGYKSFFEMIKHHAEQKTTITRFAALFNTNCNSMRIIFGHLKLSKESQKYADKIMRKKPRNQYIKKAVIMEIQTPAWDNYLKLSGLAL